MFAGFMGNSVLCTEPLEWKLGGFVFVEKALKDIIPTIRNPQFHIPVIIRQTPMLVIVTSRGASYNEAWGCCSLSGIKVWGYHDIGDDGISLALFLCVDDKERVDGCRVNQLLIQIE